MIIFSHAFSLAFYGMMRMFRGDATMQLTPKYEKVAKQPPAKKFRINQHVSKRQFNTSYDGNKIHITTLYWLPGEKGPYGGELKNLMSFQH